MLPWSKKSFENLRPELVEKKEPLTTPPEIFELPEPDKLKKTNKTQSKIQSILNSDELEVKDDGTQSSAEETILKNIKKWKILKIAIIFANLQKQINF